MKLGLQIVLGVLSLIPLLVSLLGVTLGLGRWLSPDMIDPEFDSHYRYITGYYLSLSLMAWWIIPNIEKHRTLFRIVGGCIFFGGIGRVLSWVQVGALSPLSIFFTGLESYFHCCCGGRLSCLNAKRVESERLIEEPAGTPFTPAGWIA